jgi:hypothetical protein
LDYVRFRVGRYRDELEGTQMTINIKYLIGLLLLMGIGAFLCSFLGTDSTWTELSSKATAFANSFTSEAYKGAWDVIFQGLGFIKAIFIFFGYCIFWNFSFFEGWEVVQVLLIFVNMAILAQIMVDLWRMMKPFGG